MPTVELPVGDRDLDAAGRQAHLVRTSDRIRGWKARLESAEVSQNERQIILADLTILERQLHEPLTKRELRVVDRNRELEARKQTESGLLREDVSALKAELATLKARLNAPESVPQSVPAATPA